MSEMNEVPDVDLTIMSSMATEPAPPIEEVRISHAPPGRSKLYVDILNFGEKIFSSNWDCAAAFENMTSFIEAARNSGWDLTVFIDGTALTDEAMNKWRKRREREVRMVYKNMPHAMATIIGDIFRRHEVPVIYSSELDNDDTIAFFAHADGADVLSNDRDMFRYTGFNYTVYSGYELLDRQLLLTQHYLHYTSDTKRSPVAREIGVKPRVATSVNHLALTSISGPDNSPVALYLRGSPSPLTKHLGNPHARVAPLRSTIYALMKYPQVIEEYPIWNYKLREVTWVRHTVVPEINDYVLTLLSQPILAVAHYFQQETSVPSPPPNKYIRFGDWMKHKIAVHNVVFELCVLAAPLLRAIARDACTESVFELMLQYQASMSVNTNKRRNRPSKRKREAMRRSSDMIEDSVNNVLSVELDRNAIDIDDMLL